MNRRKQEEGKGARNKKTDKDIKQEQQKVWICSMCGKTYLSYPALYTHAKQKHPTEEISSKDNKNSAHISAKKLKSLLKDTSRKQQLERELIFIAKNCCLRLFELLSADFQIEGSQLGEEEMSNDAFSKIAEGGGLAANKYQIPIETLGGGNAEIFSYQDTKIGKVSFGKEIIGFFSKSSVAFSVYLQLLLIDAISRGLQIDAETVRPKIWERAYDLKWLQEEWRKWKEAAAGLSREAEKQKGEQE